MEKYEIIRTLDDVLHTCEKFFHTGGREWFNLENGLYMEEDSVLKDLLQEIERNMGILNRALNGLGEVKYEKN